MLDSLSEHEQDTDLHLFQPEVEVRVLQVRAQASSLTSLPLCITSRVEVLKLDLLCVRGSRTRPTDPGPDPLHQGPLLARPASQSVL